MSVSTDAKVEAVIPVPVGQLLVVYCGALMRCPAEQWLKNCLPS